MSEEQKRGQEAAVAQQEAMVREIDKLHTAIAQATAQAQHAHGQSQQLIQEVNVTPQLVNKQSRSSCYCPNTVFCGRDFPPYFPLVVGDYS